MLSNVATRVNASNANSLPPPPRDSSPAAGGRFVPVVRTLRAAGVSHGFGLPSGNVLPLIEAMRLGGLPYVLTAHEGKILFAFQHLRLHEPPEGGASSYRKSVPLHPDLLHAARLLMAALRYTGVAMVEFKIDQRSGRWALIEINGRFWGSLPLAVAAGADFPYYLYQMLVEGRRDYPPGYRDELYARNWIQDASWLVKKFTAGPANPRVPPNPSPPWRQVVAEFTNVLKLRERSDTFAWDDPLPAFAELRRMLWKRIMKIARPVRHPPRLVDLPSPAERR